MAEPVITFRDDPGWSSFPTAPPAGTPSSQSASSGGWNDFPTAKPTDYGGIAKQAGIGIAKGAIGLVGLPGDAVSLIKKGLDYVDQKVPQAAPYTDVAKAYTDKLQDVLPTSEDLKDQVEDVTGPFRQPQNQTEADAQTIGEFVPAAIAGPGGLVRKAITQVALPAAASITAGRFSNQNPYVKALAGFLAGGAGTVLSGPSSAENILRAKIPASVTEQDVTRAGQLIDHANSRGVQITWPEALTRVTGQPVLTDTQRIIESHGQTRPQMQEFFAGRPAQIEQAARDEFNNLGSVSPTPSTLGPQASELSNNTINQSRQTINNASEPFYQQSENILLTPQEMTHVRAIPGFDEASEAVRNNPQINWRVAHLPDNSVGFLNEVKKHFDQAAENSASKFNPQRNKQVQSSNEMAASALKQINIAKAEEHAIANGGGPNTYQAALDIQSQSRERFLNPIIQGPVGRLAKKDMTTQRAINVLFPENPVPGTEGEIRNAVFQLARQRPAVAEQLVRAHAEMVFNQAARDLQGGANQFAGAKFAKMIAGNAQQRANLRAAIEALPNGAARWAGFERLLDIMAATGARQPKGSLTAFNQLEVQSMSSGGLQSLAAKGASPGKWMSFANDTFKAWSLGRNLDQIAHLLTSPNSGEAFRQIVRIPPRSDRALVMAGRLIAQGGAATIEQRTKKEGR